MRDSSVRRCATTGTRPRLCIALALIDWSFCDSSISLQPRASTGDGRPRPGPRSAARTAGRGHSAGWQGALDRAVLALDLRHQRIGAPAREAPADPRQQPVAVRVRLLRGDHEVGGGTHVHRALLDDGSSDWFCAPLHNRRRRTAPRAAAAPRPARAAAWDRSSGARAWLPPPWLWPCIAPAAQAIRWLFMDWLDIFGVISKAH